MNHKKLINFSFLVIFLIAIVPKISFGATEFNLTDGITNPMDINSHYTKVANGIYELKPTANYNNGIFLKNTIVPSNVTNQTLLDEEMNRYKITGTGYLVKISTDEKIIWATDIKNYISYITHEQQYIGDDDDGDSIWEDISDYYYYYNTVNFYYYNNTLCLYKFWGATGTYFDFIIIDTITGNIKYKNPSIHVLYNGANLESLYFINNWLYLDFLDGSGSSFKIDITNPVITYKDNVDSSYTFKIFNSNSYMNIHLGKAKDSSDTNEYRETYQNSTVNVFATSNIINSGYKIADKEQKDTFKIFKKALFFKNLEGKLISKIFVLYNNAEYIYNGLPGMANTTMSLATGDVLDPFYMAEIAKGSYVRAYIKDTNLIVKWFDDNLNCIKERKYSKDLFTQREISNLITNETYYMPLNVAATTGLSYWLPDKYFYDSQSFTSLVGLDFNIYFYGVKPTLIPIIRDYIVGDNTDIVLTGSIKDNNNTNGICTVTATINGVSKAITTTGAYTITFNSVEIGQGKYDVNITVTDGDKISNSMLAGSVDIEYTLKEFISRLNLLGKSGLSRISVLDMDSRKIDNNAENQKLIATIADRLNTNNIDLYAIDGGNEVIKKLSSMIK